MLTLVLRFTFVLRLTLVLLTLRLTFALLTLRLALLAPRFAPPAFTLLGAPPPRPRPAASASGAGMARIIAPRTARTRNRSLRRRFVMAGPQGLPSATAGAGSKAIFIASFGGVKT